MKHLEITFRVELGSDEGRMSDWTQDLIRRKREERDRQVLRTEKVVSDRKLIENSAPRLWSELRANVERLVRELNTEFGEDALSVEIESGSRLSVRPRNSNRAATLAFDERNASLKAPFHGAELKLVVFKGDELMWKSAAVSEFWSNEDVAKRTVEVAWKEVE